MPGDTRRTQRVELTLTYSEELSEDEKPSPGKPDIVVLRQDYVRVRKSRIKRVFYLTTCTSAFCPAMIAALSPSTAVQVTALAIWAASAGVAHFLLSSAYQKQEPPRPPDI